LGGWQEFTVADIASNEKYSITMGPFGSNITKDNFVDIGVPVIRGVNLTHGRFNPNDFVYLTNEKADDLRSSNAHPNDLVFTHRGTLGQVGIIPSTPYKRYVVSQSQMKLTCDPAKAVPMYMYYYFSSVGKTELLKHVSGSGVPAISSPLTTLKNLRIRIPPLKTQKKIASILSAYDDLIENNLKRIKILEEMAQRLYREWFVHFRFPGHENVKMVDSPLGPIPEGWEVVPFTKIADVLSGGTPKTKIEEYWGGEIPFFAPKDAPDSFYVTKTEKTITQLGLQKCNSRLYPKDTVFITARGTVGKVVMPSIDMAMNQSCYALQGKKGINQHFLFLLTKQQSEYLKKNTGGATFDTIIVETFERMLVAKPDYDLIKKFSALVESQLDVILNLINKNYLLRQTRDLLLPKLISGEVDVSSVDILT